MTGTLAPSVTATAQRCAQVLAEVERVIVGKREAVSQVLLGILASGHLLIEDLPGARQDPDRPHLRRDPGAGVHPGPVHAGHAAVGPHRRAGARPAHGRASCFRPGPVFTNLLLGDEINRTPPKTQAALLEAMAEGQVSVDGQTHPLPQPFIVLATDNPIEYEGTYPLPEAQLDRFVARIRLGYLDRGGRGGNGYGAGWTGARRPPQTAEVLDASALLAMRESLEQVHLDDDVLGYVVRLVAATRSHPQISVGASPRGTLAVIQLARGHAALDARDYVIPEDVKAVAVSALAHRLVLRPEMWVRRVTGEDLITEILTAEPVPRASQ